MSSLCRKNLSPRSWCRPHLWWGGLGGGRGWGPQDRIWPSPEGVVNGQQSGPDSSSILLPVAFFSLKGEGVEEGAYQIMSLGCGAKATLQRWDLMMVVTEDCWGRTPHWTNW